MRRDRSLLAKYETGLGLISAIFVIVIIALLVDAMSIVMTIGQGYRSQEALATRALLAAQTGAELHLSELLHPDNGNSCANTTRTLTVDGLQDCNYQASCAVITISGQNFYTINSVGRCGSGVDSATRTVKVRVTD